MAQWPGEGISHLVLTTCLCSVLPVEGALVSDMHSLHAVGTPNLLGDSCFRLIMAFIERLRRMISSFGIATWPASRLEGERQ